MNQEILKRLEEIEARAAKATPGPWKWDEIPEDGAGRYWGLWSQNRWLSDPEVLGPYPEDEDCLSVEVRQADADFIAACREDNPWLCQVVRELFARLERSEAVIEAARAYVVLGRQFETVDPIKESAKRFQALEEALAALEEGTDD